MVLINITDESSMENWLGNSDATKILCGNEWIKKVMREHPNFIPSEHTPDTIFQFGASTFLQSARISESGIIADQIKESIKRAFIRSSEIFEEKVFLFHLKIIGQFIDQ